MDIQNVQFYLYKDKANAAEVKVVEENKLIKQLERSVSSSKQEHSEDELNAAMGMVLMRCQFKTEHKQHKQIPLNPNITIQITHSMQNMRLENVTEDEYIPKNKCTTQIEQQKESALKPKISLKMTHPTQKVRLDTLKQAIIQIQNLSSKYSKAHLRTLCRNLLKKLLSENSF